MCWGRWLPTGGAQPTVGITRDLAISEAARLTGQDQGSCELWELWQLWPLHRESSLPAIPIPLYLYLCPPQLSPDYTALGGSAKTLIPVIPCLTCCSCASGVCTRTCEQPSKRDINYVGRSIFSNQRASGEGSSGADTADTAHN